MKQKESPKLENVIGTLLHCIQSIQPGTARTAAQLTTERRENEHLRKQWFWTLDTSVYEKRGEKALLHFGDPLVNPLVTNAEKAYRELRITGNYNVSASELAEVVSSPSILHLDLERLDLRKLENECFYFQIDPSRTSSLTPAQRRFAQAVYGKNPDFGKNMEVFAEAQLKPCIFVLNPEYVKEHAADGALARSPWLENFKYSSVFNVSDENFKNSRGALRGVSIVVAEDEREKNPIPPETKVPSLREVLATSRNYVSGDN